MSVIVSFMTEIVNTAGRGIYKVAEIVYFYYSASTEVWPLNFLYLLNKKLRRVIRLNVTFQLDSFFFTMFNVVKQIFPILFIY